MTAKNRDDRGGWKTLGEMTALAFTFPAAILVGYGLGWWLDRELGTGPWLTIVLTGLGVAAAFVQLFRLGARSDRTDPPSGPPG
ncbi:MAG TPA: AtpZ/AtpI family protein [Thermoanaerobaculia bacterium]|nr:AtpZ/AtpI family protein [Thermoanaerobaculia bacterium]